MPLALFASDLSSTTGGDCKGKQCTYLALATTLYYQYGSNSRSTNDTGKVWLWLDLKILFGGWWSIYKTRILVSSVRPAPF